MSFEFTPKKTIKLKILSTKSDIIKNKFVESEFVESDIVESEFVDINSESERDSECEFYSDCNIEDNNQQILNDIQSLQTLEQELFNSLENTNLTSSALPDKYASSKAAAPNLD